MIAWFKTYFKSFGAGLPPEPAATATRKAVRTGLQAAMAVIVGAGAGWMTVDVAKGAAVAAVAAVFAFIQNALGK